MNSEELKVRTKSFGLKIIAVVEQLPRTRTAEVVGKQLLRCAVSVGANYRSACRAKSRNDFICKINIVEEEADEAAYWLEILMSTRLLDGDQLFPLLKEASELAAIFTASGKTAKDNKIGSIRQNSQFAFRNSQ